MRGGGRAGGEAFAGRGAGGIKVGHEAPDVGGIEKVDRGHGHKIGIAQKLGAVAEGATHGLREKVQFGGGVGAEGGDVVRLDHAEHLEQGDAGGGGRGHGDDFMAAVGAADGLALDGAQGGEIGGGDEAAVRGHVGREELRGLAFVKLARALGLQAGERRGEFGLGKNFAHAVVIAVAQEDAFRFG